MAAESITDGGGDTNIRSAGEMGLFIFEAWNWLVGFSESPEGDIWPYTYALVPAWQLLLVN